jgi:thiamine pyrophosphokinase
MTTVVVFAAGPDQAAAVSFPSDSRIVVADGGAAHALRLGLAVDVAVGDFDSISAADLDVLERASTRVVRHDRAKDKTDLELALDLALELHPRRILVVGSAGGRLDHAFGQMQLLGSEAYRSVQIDAQLGSAAIHVVRDERSLKGTPGDLISLFALHGPAVGVVTEGLVYPLHGETLAPGSSRGVSNLFAAADVRITVEQGVLLAVRPGEEDVSST